MTGLLNQVRPCYVKFIFYGRGFKPTVVHTLKERVLHCLKLGLTLLLILYVLNQVPFASILAQFHTLKPAYLVLSLILLITQFWISAYRWQHILHTLGTRLAFKTVYQINWMALFFNQALPASVGGDALRVLALRRLGASWKQVSYGIILGHLGMIFSLAIIACLGLALFYQQTGFVESMLMPFWIGSVGLLLGVGLFLVLCYHWGSKFPRPFRGLSRACQAFVHRPIAGFYFTSLSFLSAFMLVLVCYTLAKALSIPIAFSAFIFLMPVVILVSSLPISIGGWGTREVASVLLFGQMGIVESAALSLSLLLAFSSILVSLPGAFYYLKNKVVT